MWKGGECSYQIPVKVVDESTLSVELHREQSGFNILNRPNPFTSETTLYYDLAQSGHVTISLFSIGGDLIEALCDEHQSVGEKAILYKGEELSSGLNFCKIEVDIIIRILKMIKE